MNKVGCIYHPKLPDDQGRLVAEELVAIAARQGVETWAAPAWDEEATEAQMHDTDLLLCIGGDGTVLRGARSVVPHPTLLLGINMGRLGFLTELDADTARQRLPEIVAGAGYVEERAMLHAEIVPAMANDNGDRPARHDALNDVVIGRATLGRTVQVTVRIDSAVMAELRADGVIVATATGSTAYSLSAGGPILSPESSDILFTPLAPHLASRNSVVLPQSAVVEVQLAARQQATFSIDGEQDNDLAPGETVRVALGPHKARFLRLRPRSDFYQRLARRLSWLGQDGTASAADESGE